MAFAIGEQDSFSCKIMLISPRHSFLNSLLTVHKLSYSLHASVRYSSIFSSPSGWLYNLGKITSRPRAIDLPSGKLRLVSNPPLARSVEVTSSGVGQLRMSAWSLRIICILILSNFSHGAAFLMFDHAFALTTLQHRKYRTFLFWKT